MNKTTANADNIHMKIIRTESTRDIDRNYLLETILKHKYSFLFKGKCCEEIILIKEGNSLIQTEIDFV